MSSPTATIESRMPESAPDAGKRLPNSVLAMIIFIVMEIMFFAGLMSAHTIARATAMGGVWPPAWAAALAGGTHGVQHRDLASQRRTFVSWPAAARAPATKRRAAYLAGAIVTGISFVLLQGVEWVRLLREGLTMTSSAHGAFFYLIVGAHALHAVVAIAILTAIYFPMRRGTLSPSTFTATQIILVFRRPSLAGDLFACIFVRSLCA